MLGLAMCGFSQASPGHASLYFNTLAGARGARSADGTGSAARFNSPYSVADTSGNVYVADQDNVIRKTSAGVVTTLAGSAGVSGSADGTRRAVHPPAWR